MLGDNPRHSESLSILIIYSYIIQIMNQKSILVTKSYVIDQGRSFLSKINHFAIILQSPISIYC